MKEEFSIFLLCIISSSFINQNNIQILLTIGKGKSFKRFSGQRIFIKKPIAEPRPETRNILIGGEDKLVSAWLEEKH